MANPQMEDGHVKIANDLLEAMIKQPMPDAARCVFLAIIRKTYGFNKKRDTIAARQLMNLTALGERQVRRALRWLEDARMIRRDSLNAMTEIVKDFDQWRGGIFARGGDRNVRVTKLSGGGDKIVRKGVTKLSPSKDTLTKDNTSSKEEEGRTPFVRPSIPKKERDKLLPEEPIMKNETIDQTFPRYRLYGDEAFNWLLDYTEFKWGYKLSAGEKWNRIACRHLKNKIGLGKVRELVDWLAEPENFWHGKIRSMMDLYKRYDRLLNDMEHPNAPKQNQPIRKTNVTII